MEPNLNDKLLENEPMLNKPLKQFSISYLSELFELKNIDEGHSLQRFKAIGRQGFFKGLKVNEKTGVNSSDSSDIEYRRKEFGTNAPIKRSVNTFWDFVENSLEDEMLKILIVASVVSTIIGIWQDGFVTGWIEGFSIFLAVVIVVSITSYQNYTKDLQFRKLEEENQKKNVKVRRNGIEIQEIPVEDILVGDIIHLAIGDIAPVDGILISGLITVDESSITGETDLFKKVSVEELMINKETPFVISGSEILDGSGQMLVLVVGENTVGGKATSDSSEENSMTPLQGQLTIVADKIGELGFIAAIFIGIVMISKDIFSRYQHDKDLIDYYLIDSVMNAFIICITVIVVAIPEGLPMAVTISLAFSVFKMKEEKNLVKHIDASETMGNVNNVCTDKTGTLTKGIMEVRQFYLENKNYSKEESKVPEETHKLVVESIINNISSYIEKVDDNLVAKGNPTEAALLQFLLNRKEINHGFKKQTIFKELAFNSTNKYMASITKIDDVEDKYRLYIKGAPEKIFGVCSEFRVAGDKTEPLNNHLKSIIEQQEKYALNSYRTIAIGYKDLTLKQTDLDFSKEGLEFFEQHIKDIVLLAIFAIADGPRDDVYNSIIRCHNAGVLVRMITGDNIKTAISIARDVSILTPEEAKIAYERINNPQSVAKDEKMFALNGNEFREISGGFVKVEDGKDKKGNLRFKFELVNQDKFRRTVENLKVIARASPDDKYLLVLGLKQLGNIVAVTGDGTNDASALRKADVGFAMGIRGTDVAKAASDIVLLNDSFSSIVTAIKYGRNVYDCIRKFLQFQLTCNIVAVFMTLLGGVILEDSPLNPIQMLWVNLIMDSFASLALATEPPSDKLLNRKPYPKDSSIVTSTMKVNIAAQAVFQIIVLTIIIFYGDLIFDIPSDRTLDHFTWNDNVGYHFTIFFHIFVLLQVFNSINARKLSKAEINVFENIFNNKLYILIQIIIVLGQVLMVTFGGRALRTHPLTLNQHLVCAIIASLSLVVGVLIKLLPFGADTDEESKFGYRSGFSISKSIRGKSVDLSTIKTKRSLTNIS